MSATEFIKSAERDAKIIDALHVARYALVINNGLTVRCEGEFFPLDFETEIQQIDTVMQMLGIDTTQPLPAPVQWREHDEDQ